MKDLYVTWDEYHPLIEQLAMQIHSVVPMSRRDM